MPHPTFQASVTHVGANMRLDQWLAQSFSAYSRGQWQTWLRDGRVLVNANAVTLRQHNVKAGDLIVAEPRPVTQASWAPQAMALDVRFEDDDLLILHKPAGLTVHPGAGQPDGTLANALLHRLPDQATLPRAGIVHRLDQWTSGLMVVAKTLTSHHRLVEAMQARNIGRQYLALVHGTVRYGGTVDEAIGRHRTHRIRMAVDPRGKPAMTHYRVQQALHGCTLLNVQLETGRTHQIRVHMSHLGHPLVGDALYGGRKRFPKGLATEQLEVFQAFKRQALHAHTLSLPHPRTGALCAWSAELPEDMVRLLDSVSLQPS